LVICAETSDISPLDAVLLLNDDNVDHLFGEKRPAVEDLHVGDFCLRHVERKQRKKGDDVWEGPYMVTAQLGDRTFELESEFVVDIDDLRVFRYSDLCRCSKDAFSRCLTLWGLDGIEKDFIDVFGSISGYYYRRDRDGWSMDWTDQRILISTDFRLLFDALLKLLTQLPEHSIVCIPECSSSESLKLLHSLDAEWIKVAKEEIDSQSIYFDVFIVGIDVPATRALLLEWKEC